MSDAEDAIEAARKRYTIKNGEWTCGLCKANLGARMMENGEVSVTIDGPCTDSNNCLNNCYRMAMYAHYSQLYPPEFMQ